MSFFDTINWVDATFGLVMLLFAFRGLLRGMVKETIGLIGMSLGFFLATRYSPDITGYFDPWIINKQFKMYAAYATIFFGVNFIGILISFIIKKCMGMAMVSWLDPILGGLIGLAKGGMLSAIGFTLLQKIAPSTPFLKDSMLVSYTDQIMAFSSFFLPIMK